MLKLTLLLPFIVAAPFLKSALGRRGAPQPVAFACGFALLAIGVLIVRSIGSL
jgi:hypothetical protein